MLAALLLAALAAAQPGVHVVQATGDLRVDGILDEADWARAEVVTELEQYIPVYGGAPPGRTEIRLLQDERHLYVGIRVSEVDYPLRARMSERERINADDQIGIYIDTFRDGQGGYIFYLNPLGLQQDTRFYSGNYNGSWDAVFQSRGRITEDGYELEVSFPFRSLKYRAGEEIQEWGLMLTRKVPALGTKYSWPRLERGHPQLFSQCRPMRGVKPPRRGSGLELIPSVTAVQAGRRRSTADPLEYNGLDPWHEAVRPSLDARFGITPNIGLTAAANPDFSQVESDTTQISLNQRFAYWYPERRPFFLEGAGYFSDRPDTLYTRSIVDPLYGIKVAGQEGPWSVGVLHALDRAPSASVHERGTPGFDAGEVQDAMAENAMARVRVEVLEEGWVGVTLADKRILRDQTGTTRGVHDLVGTDFLLPLGGRWTAAGHVFQSFTGIPGEGRTWGQHLSGGVGRNSGEGTGFYLGAGSISDGHRRETGFLTQSGIQAANLYLDHTFEPRGGLVDTWVPSLWAYADTEIDGDHWREVFVEQEVLLGAVHDLRAWGEVNHRSWEGIDVDGWNTGISYTGVLGSALTVNPSAWAHRGLVYDESEAGLTRGADLDLTVRPISPLRIDVDLHYEHLAPETAAPESATRIRTHTRYQFTAALGLRAIVEHTDGTARDPVLITSLLATWLEHPGTAFYVGYAETTSLAAGARGALDRTVFAKASVLLRP